MKWEKAEGSAWKDGEEQNLNTYHCESCGGEIVADENTGGIHLPLLRQPDRHDRESFPVICARIS